MSRFIGVISGKGGTGKTIVAINLALALNEFGHSVILVDSDYRSADIGILLGMPPHLHTLHDVLAGKKAIHEVVYHHPSGLNFIPGSIGLQPDNLSNDLSSLMKTMNGMAEIIVMDLPPGLNSDVFSLMKPADEALIITNPELTAVTDALRTIALLEKEGKKIRGVVINRVGHESDMSLQTVQEMVEKEILAVIPEDSYVKKSVQLKYPVSYAYPLAPSSVSFKNLAAKILQKHKKSKLRH